MGRYEKYEVAFDNGKVFATFKNPSILRKFMDCVEDEIKSKVFNNNYREAKDLIGFLLDLEDAYKTMEEGDKNEESDGTRL